MVLSLPARSRVFLARGATDMRKSFDGLCNLVRHAFDLDPFEGDVFVFLNRRRNYVKLLVWDDNGFWICAKRLEGGTFEHWSPEVGDATHVQIDRARLAMLLEGIELKKAEFRHHFPRGIRMSGDRGGGAGQSEQVDQEGRCRQAQ